MPDVQELVSCVSSTKKTFQGARRRALRHHGKARADGLRAAKKIRKQAIAGCKRRFG